MGLTFGLLALLVQPAGPGEPGPLAPRGAVLSAGTSNRAVAAASNARSAASPGVRATRPEAMSTIVRRAHVGEPPAPTAPETLGGYRWPLKRGRITVAFGPVWHGTHVVDGERFHDGIDIATFCGDRIAAAHEGVVLAAGRRFDRYVGWVGNLQPYFDVLDEKGLWPSLPIVVVVDDGNGYRSLYAHLSRVTVKRGQRIHAGQLIGYEGATGRASGCHLHYGLFSPLETATFKTRSDVVKRMRVPARETARIDPLRVLPRLPPAIRLSEAAAVLIGPLASSPAAESTGSYRRVMR